MTNSTASDLPSGSHDLHLQMGSTLVEVLVSLLVIAGGLMGIAGVQSVSLRNNQASYFRTQAITASADMVERMRANKIGVEAGAYDNVTGSATSSCFTVAGCTPAQLAAQDVLDWTTHIESVLPEATAVVCIDSTGDDGEPGSEDCDGSGRIYAVKIWWDDDRDGDAESRYVTSWQPW